MRVGRDGVGAANGENKSVILDSREIRSTDSWIDGSGNALRLASYDIGRCCAEERIGSSASVGRFSLCAKPITIRFRVSLPS